MVARKTKRVAVVTAVSASLMMAGAAAFAQENHEEPVITCSRPGNGQGHGHPGNGKGNGATRGWWHKCVKHDNDGGSDTGGSNTGGQNTGGQNTGGQNTGGGTNSDDDGISVEVNVEVNLPNVPVPDAAMAVDSAVDHALSAVHQTVTLAESDVAQVMAIVQSAGQGATSLVYGTAQAGVSLSGTDASGAVNVSSGVAGATSLGSNLVGSTLNLVNGNVSGGRYILGTMLSML